jgi:hypothetical protein
MKVLSIVSLIVLAWGAPALAESSLLTEDQLSSVIAGSEFIDIVNASDQDADGGVQVVDDVTSFVINDDVVAENLVNLSETVVDNSVRNDNSTNVLFFADDAQRDAIAVDIINSVGTNKVAVGINALFVHEPLPNELGQSSGSFFPGVNQSNISIIK